MWRGLEQSLIDDAVDQWPTRLCACVSANSGHFNIPCDCKFGICFSMYLMNFMFHTTLDAVGNILRVYYKSMKCDVSFSQGSVSRPTLFTEVNMFFVYV